MLYRVLILARTYTHTLLSAFAAICAVLFTPELCAQKQLSIHNVHVRVRPLDNNVPLDFSKVLSTAEFREYLNGETRIGSFQPVVIVECVAATPQDTLRVLCRITNRATRKIVYATSKVILPGSFLDSVITGVVFCDSLGRGLTPPVSTHAMSPGEYAKMVFPPYEPSGFVDDQTGALLVEFVTKCYPVTLPEEQCNSADQDTMGFSVNSMRRLESLHWSFRIPEFHNIPALGTLVPSIHVFCAWGPSVIADSLVDGAYRIAIRRKATNSATLSLDNPVILMDRNDESGKRYPGGSSGDTLTSFPVNLDRSEGASLVVCARRGGRPGAEHRRWLEDSLVGPEPTVISGSSEISGDSLIIELMRPSPDGLNGIINTGQSNWIDQPLFRAALLMNVAITPSRSTVYSIAIPDSIINSVNEGARNSRFRITLRARDHGPLDDADPWLIDEIHVYKKSNHDVSLQDVNIPLPYSVIGHRQAAVAPVEVYVSNRTQNVHHNIRVRLYAQSMRAPGRSVVYEHVIDSLAPLQQLRVGLPTLNLNELVNPLYFDTGRQDTVLLVATITKAARADGVDTLYKDDFPYNDTIMRRIPLRIGRALGYDAYEDEGHHVVAEEAGVGTGFGLRTNAYASITDSPLARYGGSPATNAAEAGSITMRFHSAWTDTLYAYQFAFDIPTPNTIGCTVDFYRIDGLGEEHRLGHSFVFFPGRADEGAIDSIGTYTLHDPIALEAGNYLVRLRQESSEPLNLCTTAARAGVFVQHAESNLNAGSAVPASPDFYDGVTNSFPYYMQTSTGPRTPFVGDASRVFYSYGNSTGSRSGKPTFRRGTWMPVMRVVLGHIPTDVPLSVAESDGSLSVTVAPNPAHDIVRVASASMEHLQCELSALTGELVGKGLGEGSVMLDVSRVAAGTYLLRIMSGSTTTTQMIVVQH